MAGHTDTLTSTAGTDEVGAPPVRDWLLRAMVGAIVALTLTLAGWAATQAAAVEAVLDDQVAQPNPSIRQVERAAQVQEELEQRDAVETRRFENRVQAAAEVGSGRLSTLDLLGLEYTELRRFRNRAPAGALPALDAEIERLRGAIDVAGSS